MTDQLFCYAADETAVAGLIGLGLRDADLAERCYARILEYATDEPLRGWDNADLAVRTLLWRGDPLLPMDAPADTYWHALEAIIAAIAVDHVEPVGMEAAADFDAVALASRVPRVQLPRAIARPPRIDLPAASSIYIRVIPREKALSLFQTFLAADDGKHAYLSEFARNFATLAARRVNKPDLWMVTPGTALRQKLNPEWPPGPVPAPIIPPILKTTVALRSVADEGPRPDLDERLINAKGYYECGHPEAPDGAWVLMWRREDGLVRLINQRPDHAERRWYGRLEHLWRDEFELAAVQAGIGRPQKFRSPGPAELILDLRLGTNRLQIPSGVVLAEEPWTKVFHLLDVVCSTLAGPVFPWAEADGRYVKPV